MGVAGSGAGSAQSPRITVTSPHSPCPGLVIINTALSVARQIAGGHASSAITIGYPPFAGIFTSSGSDSSPQAQAQQQSGGFSGGIRNTPRCYTSNSGDPKYTVVPQRDRLRRRGRPSAEPS